MFADPHTLQNGIATQTGNATNVKHTGSRNMMPMGDILSKGNRLSQYRQNLKNFIYWLIVHT
jgi:hypothetical protein